MDGESAFPPINRRAMGGRPVGEAALQATPIKKRHQARDGVSLAWWRFLFDACRRRCNSPVGRDCNPALPTFQSLSGLSLGSLLKIKKMLMNIFVVFQSLSGLSLGSLIKKKLLHNIYENKFQSLSGLSLGSLDSCSDLGGRIHFIVSIPFRAVAGFFGFPYTTKKWWPL